MFIDTHCHIDLILGLADNQQMLPQAIAQAKALMDETALHNVSTVITIGTNIDSSKKSTILASQIDPIYATIGIHPCDTTPDITQKMDMLVALYTPENQTKIVGIGETGLDYYHPGFIVEQQKEYFRRHIKFAAQNNLPIIIHSRNAFADTIAVLDECAALNPRGIFHCFSEDLTAVKEVLARGFLIGIDGHISYPKNHSLRDAIAYAGLDHVVLETDSPFLAPQQVRGTKNHPGNIPLIAAYLSEHVFVDNTIEEIGYKTTKNALEVFDKLPQDLLAQNK